LKRSAAGTACRRAASPPARGRGLKRSELDERRPGWVVAPRAGAWIETSRGLDAGTPFLVAPRAGAWIETSWRNRCW